MSEYTCAACGGVFEETQTEEEALAEYAAAFPGSAARNAPKEVVCDDCYKKMLGQSPPNEWEQEEWEEWE